MLMDVCEKSVLNVYYHDESKCYLCWCSNNVCYVYLRRTCMDEFHPPHQFDYVKVVGYFLIGVHNNMCYVYDWSTWNMVFTHAYTNRIVYIGMVHADVYVLTCEDTLFINKNICKEHITNLCCNGEKAFYTTSQQLYSQTAHTSMKHALALYMDDTYVYALTTKRTLVYFDYRLRDRATFRIPSHLSIQSICRLNEYVVMQSLDGICVLDASNALVYEKQFDESVWLSMSSHFLAVCDVTTRIYDLTRLVTCLELSKGSYVFDDEMRPLYARLLLNTMSSWYRKADVNRSLLQKNKCLYRLFLYKHCDYVRVTGALDDVKRLVTCTDSYACHEMLRYCTWFCRDNMDRFESHIVTLLVFLFDKIKYYPTRSIWNYCLRYATECCYWFSLVLSSTRSHLLIRDLCKRQHLDNLFMCLTSEKALEMCKYGMVPLWIRACQRYHQEHCNMYQDKIKMFRMHMVDAILSDGYQSYGVYRKAGFTDVTPALISNTIRHHQLVGKIKHVTIQPDRTRKWSWEHDQCLLPEINKNMSFEVFQPVSESPKNSLEAAIHLLDTKRFWLFSGGWQKHGMCKCLLYNTIRHCRTKKESIVIHYDPLKMILGDDTLDAVSFGEQYEVYKSEVVYTLPFVYRTKLMHYILDTYSKHPETPLGVEYKESLFELMKINCDITVEYERRSIECMFLNRFGNRMYIANREHLVRMDKTLVVCHEDKVCDILSMGDIFVSGSIDGALMVRKKHCQRIQCVKGTMRIRWLCNQLIWVLHQGRFIAEYDLTSCTCTRTLPPLQVSEVNGFETLNGVGYVCAPEVICVVSPDKEIQHITVPTVVFTCIGYDTFFHLLVGTTSGSIYKLTNNTCVPLPVRHKHPLTHVGGIHGLLIAIDTEEIVFYQDGEIVMTFDVYPERIVRFQYDMYGRCIVAYENRFMTIYWEQLIKVKCLHLTLTLMKHASMNAYIHTHQQPFLTHLVASMETEDALQVIYESVQTYDYRRMWCKPWVTNMCLDDQGTIALSILRKLCFYTGKRFDECSICFTIATGQDIMKLTCGHLFHRDCIETFFDTLPSYENDMLQQYALVVQPSCPNCRHPCTRNDIHKDTFWSTQNNSI